MPSSEYVVCLLSYSSDVDADTPRPLVVPSHSLAFFPPSLRVSLVLDQLWNQKSSRCSCVEELEDPPGHPARSFRYPVDLPRTSLTHPPTASTSKDKTLKSSCLQTPIQQVFLRETPRFLIKQGRPEQARANLAYLRNLPPDHPYLAEELAAIERQIGDVSVLHSKEEKEGFWAWFGAYWKGLWRYIFAKGIRNRMAIGCVLFSFPSFRSRARFFPHFRLGASLWV